MCLLSIVRKGLGLLILSVAAGAPGVPLATETLTCNHDYTVVSGDTLSTIAHRAYGKSDQYTLIYYTNKSVLKSGPGNVRSGQVLRIPCMEGDQPEAAADPANVVTVAEPAVVATGEAVATPAGKPAFVMQVLTAGDYQPFTDQSLPGGGLVTELVEAALKNQNASYKISWINDWSAHLNPLLKEKKYDVGFPWLNPGCPGVDSFRCEFLFSTPIFEMLEVLFTRTKQPLVFEKDDDMLGHTLCRPSGYFTHDLERPGREWLKKKLITLQQPQTVKECFELLMDDKVDAVALNDFTGREAIAKLGLQDEVIALDHELSVEGLHVLAHKTHPRATIMINQINKGLKALQDSGDYDAIMEKHLMHHWKTVESLQKQSVDANGQ